MATTFDAIDAQYHAFAFSKVRLILTNNIFSSFAFSGHIVQSQNSELLKQI